MILYKVVYYKDLTILQSTLLAYLTLFKNKKISVDAISNGLIINKQTIYRNLKTLEEKGYIIKNKHFDYKTKKYNCDYIAVMHSNASTMPKRGAKKEKLPEWYDEYKTQVEEQAKKKEEERAKAKMPSEEEIKAFFDD